MGWGDGRGDGVLERRKKPQILSVFNEFGRNVLMLRA